MRSLTKVFVALLLTATICLGGFNSNANASPIHSLDHNQASSASDARSEIHPNEAVEIPVMSLPYKRVVEVANKTRCILKRVGVYNTASKWSLGDVSPLRAVGQQFSDDVFSFASNYQIDCGIGQEHRNVQFSAALTSDGTQNVNVGIINRSGNQPAKLTLDEMTYGDKSVDYSPFQVNAFIKQSDQTTIWFFEVTEKI